MTSRSARIRVTFNHANAFTSLSGDASLDLFGYVVGTATLDFKAATMDVSTGNTDLAPTLTGASVVSLELSNLNLFGGVGAKLNVNDPSTIADDDIDLAEAVGFSIDNGSASFVSVKPSGLAANDQTSYTGFEVSLDAVALAGLEDVELWVTSASLKLNLAKAADGSSSTARIDWDTATQGAGDPDDLLADLDIDKNLPLQVAGNATLRVGAENNLVGSVTGFALNIATMDVDTDNPNIGEDGILDDADVFSLTVGDADLFIGAGGPGLDPTTHAPEALPDGAIGFSVTNASFTLVTVKADDKTYFGIDANLGDALLAVSETDCLLPAK